ncbi:autotransporter outer membrane beta-barrel domain-containing protein [Lawsonia intracellularis]|uniref:NA n=2 Tax=Lawsonia intracellularis TaxID=29546 RepID=Q1MNS4_LAWIP|nr:autotransporter outer membrane beta-barrel domain-containing protein [Lawsonia intracellularis]AGC50723.1 hypothetical protein LAW_30055 [Lawsonia intracellularis N343]KAA0204158.1 autotransporter domain-containing protein [Lawsonia intracellularis]MBZ3893231.1 autotransporter outer membrane beta-barrel domain-containing protein [Lawsonia intracellularis]RBN31877.1 autotransporter outer membrane beta-barrel domain-containing protein [Lawsonia intracellularis]RBN32684.1 autotransporter outer
MKKLMQQTICIQQVMKVFFLFLYILLVDSVEISLAMHKQVGLDLRFRSSFSSNQCCWLSIPNMYSILRNSVEKDLQIWEEERQCCKANMKWLRSQINFFHKEILILESQITYWREQQRYWNSSSGRAWRNSFLFWQDRAHHGDKYKRRFYKERCTFSEDCRKNTWIASGFCWHCEIDAKAEVKKLQKSIEQTQKKIVMLESCRQQLNNNALKGYLERKKTWKQRFCLWTAADQRALGMFQQQSDDEDDLTHVDSSSDEDSNSSSDEYESCDEEFFDAVEDLSTAGLQDESEAPARGIVLSTQGNKEGAKDSTTDGGQQSSEVKYSSLKLMGQSACKVKADFIPGYNLGGHISSLIGMQGILLDISDQVSIILKTLPLKAYEFSDDEIDNFSLNRKNALVFLTGRKRLHRLYPTFSKKEKVHFPLYRTFFTVEGYKTNLEYKTRLGQAGIIIDSCSDMCIGLSYYHQANEMKKYGEVRLGSGIGSSKAKTELEAISAMMVWNPNKKGITGHIVSFYGWGSIKNTRSFTHMDGELHVKGNPEAYLMGGLLQVGYTIFQSNTLSVTPYIELMASTVGWNAFKEFSGLLPCEVSRNTERKVEKRIGIRSHWKTTNTSQLQTWMSAVLGTQHTNSISSKPIIALTDKYKASVPGYKRNYTRFECGFVYSMKLSERLEMNLSGLTHIMNTKRYTEQNINLQWTYFY